MRFVEYAVKRLIKKSSAWLISQHPYKEAWSNEKAFNKLNEFAGEKQDAECVDVFIQKYGVDWRNSIFFQRKYLRIKP